MKREEAYLGLELSARGGDNVTQGSVPGPEVVCQGRRQRDARKRTGTKSRSQDLSDHGGNDTTTSRQQKGQSRVEQDLSDHDGNNKTTSRQQNGERRVRFEQDLSDHAGQRQDLSDLRGQQGGHGRSQQDLSDKAREQHERGAQGDHEQPDFSNQNEISSPPSRLGKRSVRRIGGRNEMRSDDPFKIPERRAAIGSPQDVTDEEQDFLRTALEMNLPMVMQQRNPK